MEWQTKSGETEGAKTAISQLDSNQPIDTQKVLVTRVIDGDTIEISAIGGPASGGEGGQKVRYIGIDTPETVDPRKPVQCFGIEASNKNKELVEGKTISLEKDVSETDKYGRLLRYVHLPSEASAKEGVGDIFINDYLVRQGFAHSSSYPPDIKYQNQLTQAQQEAESNNRGLWSNCNSQSISITQPAQTQQAPDPNCVIKGNISSSGEKIYHMPGQNYYNKTQIDTQKGEKWFCTEQEAQQAGWRKSKI